MNNFLLSRKFPLLTDNDLVQGKNPAPTAAHPGFIAARQAQPANRDLSTIRMKLRWENLGITTGAMGNSGENQELAAPLATRRRACLKNSHFLRPCQPFMPTRRERRSCPRARPLAIAIRAQDRGIRVLRQSRRRPGLSARPALRTVRPCPPGSARYRRRRRSPPDARARRCRGWAR